MDHRFHSNYLDKIHIGNYVNFQLFVRIYSNYNAVMIIKGYSDHIKMHSGEYKNYSPFM